MKKVLSVLLAAAMVMGMSVSAFAANTKADVYFGNAATSIDSDIDVDRIQFVDFMLVSGSTKTLYSAATSKDADLKAGDVLYFPLYVEGPLAMNNSFLDKDWRIKINNADYVASADWYIVDTAAKATASNLPQGYTAIKITLEEDFDHYEEDTVSFYFSIYDREFDKESDKVEVVLNFADFAEETLVKEDLSWVLVVDNPTTYTYKKGEKAAKATVDFDGTAYTEFKMYGGEKYTLSASTKYNKDLSKEYDVDVEVINFRMSNVENFDILFPAAKDNKQIVAVVDGELVPVEATYVEDHKFQSGKKADGYLVEDAEYTAYAVIDADVEIEVEAETEVEAPVEADKANPETGAADFVGAAVAMAVVSVAAAGALALKK